MGKSGSKRWQLEPDAGDPSQENWAWIMDGEDDLDDLFHRVREGHGTSEDHELFDACMLDRFVLAVHSGKQVPPWIMEALATAFCKVLAGAELGDELRLPGRPVTSPWKPLEQRDLGLYCAVANSIAAGSKVGDALVAAAQEASVSFETARAAYYRWKNSFSKDPEDI